MPPAVRALPARATQACVNGVCVCLLPLKRNDYRPLTLRHKPLAFISALLITAKILTLGVFALTPTTAELSTITTARIVQLTNAERTKNGLNTLAQSPKLTQAAAAKGAHMLEEDYFAHISPSGVTPWFWMNKAGYAYQVAGENLAIDFVEAEDVVAAWLASPTHKENMLLPAYTETGVAVVTGEFQDHTSTIVVHMFGLPIGQTTLPANATADTSASPTPSPSPAATPPAPPPPDTTAPRPPRIALQTPATIQTTATLRIESESLTTIHFLANNQEIAQAAADATGTLTHTLDLKHLPDGHVALQSFATDATGNRSAVSETITVTKDTAGPALADRGITVVLSPATDQASALVTVKSEDTVSLTLTDDTATLPVGQAFLVNRLPEVLSLTLRDAADNQTPHQLALVPQFNAAADPQSLTPPARLTQSTRLIAIAVMLVVSLLLALAIFVRFNIQRPALIAHSLLVLGLASLFLFI